MNSSGRMRSLIENAIQKKLVRGLKKSVKLKVDSSIKELMGLLSDEQLLEIFNRNYKR